MTFNIAVVGKISFIDGFIGLDLRDFNLVTLKRANLKINDHVKLKTRRVFHIEPVTENLVKDLLTKYFEIALGKNEQVLIKWINSARTIQPIHA